VVAMDIVYTDFQSMHVQFRMGRLPRDWAADLEDDEDGALQRYMCASVIRDVVDVLHDLWLPLRDRMLRAAPK
jgi:hypothetical protein